MLKDRALIRVAGSDATAFLQGLLTQDMQALAPAHPLYAGLLSPQGKALFTMLVHARADEPESVFLDVDAGQAEALLRRLTLYRMRKAVTLAMEPALAVLADWQTPPADSPLDPRSSALGTRWLAAAADAAGLPCGAEAYRAHRVALGIAEAAEIGHDELLWLETGADLLNGVSFTKGCYVGQENTARMHHRDRVRRRLVPMKLAGIETVDGQLRDSDGRVVGSLRGAVVEGRAIAHLRLEAAAAPLLLGTDPAELLRPDWLLPALEAAVPA